MLTDRPLTIRPANPSDRQAIMALTRFEERVHAHLDWKTVEDWLGTQPYLIAERGRRVMGALACPPDPPDTAWLRLFAAVDDVDVADLWQRLWARARSALKELGVQYIAMLSLDPWLGELAEATGFSQTHAVVVLARPRGPLRTSRPENSPAMVRPALPEDYDAIVATDQAAFEAPWKLSGDLIRLAMSRADWLTVAEVDGQVAGYQLSTPSHQGAHLARLAVRPEWQGQRIGSALLADLIDYYNRRGAREITVNTQDTNRASLTLYQHLGFVLTGTRFPVYQETLSQSAAERVL